MKIKVKTSRLITVSLLLGLSIVGLSLMFARPPVVKAATLTVTGEYTVPFHEDSRIHSFRFSERRRLIQRSTPSSCFGLRKKDGLSAKIARNVQRRPLLIAPSGGPSTALS